MMSLEDIVAKKLCEVDHLNFTAKFFHHRQGGQKFRINWHHMMIADALQGVMDGKHENLLINVPPGSSKTEMAVINFMARGLALNPRARFLHLSYSDDLALLNSQTSRDLVTSEEFQDLWGLGIAPDAKSKNRWNVMVDGKSAGGVYAVSLDGQITGFRAGRMLDGFQGALIIDDPIKPEDIFSDVKTKRSIRKLLTVVKSRRANPKTPIIMIMQRLGEKDPSGFMLSGNIVPLSKLHKLIIPAILTPEYVKTIPEKYLPFVDKSTPDEDGNISYWQYKEPIDDLNAMKRGEGTDADGSRISRFVFSSQYDQNPVPVGGNIIRGAWFPRYKVLPKITYKKIFADTAQKTKEHNDYSVFECWGAGDDGRIYLLDMIRGKWEAPELKRRAIAFWNKHAVYKDFENVGKLREMIVEDKSSGTGLIQDIKTMNSIPIKGIERNKDKYTRLMDVLAEIEAGQVCLPEDAPFVNDFIQECEAVTADNSHAHDDQIDPMIDAINDMVSNKNKLRVWERANQ
jgi:predicted phage terminase large subunit-like protein